MPRQADGRIARHPRAVLARVALCRTALGRARHRRRRAPHCHSTRNAHAALPLCGTQSRPRCELPLVRLPHSVPEGHLNVCRSQPEAALFVSAPWVVPKQRRRGGKRVSGRTLNAHRATHIRATASWLLGVALRDEAGAFRSHTLCALQADLSGGGERRRARLANGSRIRGTLARALAHGASAGGYGGGQRRDPSRCCRSGRATDAGSSFVADAAAGLPGGAYRLARPARRTTRSANEPERHWAESAPPPTERQRQAEASE
ncbi:hypothetical protein ERJ75_001168200 [Trypanosoma vivax]|nr:hypothetical protein ERJ75_001168200 [Trypanosoma vivax]